jgi:hypothetical protein
LAQVFYILMHLRYILMHLRLGQQAHSTQTSLCALLFLAQRLPLLLVCLLYLTDCSVVSCA